MLSAVWATGRVEPECWQTTYSDRIAKATTDMDLILDFVDHVRNRPASDNEHRWLTEALHHVNRVTAQDVK